MDTDQYLTVADDPANVDWATWQRHILTSMLKRTDTGVYAVLGDYARGSVTPGTRVLGLAANGVDLSYSGGFLKDLRPVIEAWRAKVVAGSIDVPCIPADRVAEAQALGTRPPGCGG